MFSRNKKNLTQHRSRLLRLANSWCADPMLADDLVQEALEKAVKHAHQLKDQDKLEPWLLRILHNCLMAYLRSKRPSADIDEVEVAHQESPDRDYGRQEIADRVRLAVGKLPVGQRQVVTLVDLEDCSYSEVADALNIPIGTVMSRLSRARQSLKQSLLQFKGATSEPGSNIRRIK